MSRRYNEDDLAYGDYHGQAQDEAGERGLVGDIYNRFRGRRSQQQQQQPVGSLFTIVPQSTTSHADIYPQTPSGADQPPATGQDPYQYHHDSGKPSSSGMSGLFTKLHGAVRSVADDVKGRIASRDETHGHTHESGLCSDGTHDHHAENRYFSFAPQREGNDVKWYVDACGYMWAVSEALEQAKESIWILDCTCLLSIILTHN